MSKSNLAAILDDCLQRLQAGATVDDCLSHHAAQAAELAPMLAAAVQLQSLASYRLSAAQKLRGRVALRNTLATRRQPHRWLPRGSGFGRVRGLALSGVAALCLFVALTISAVAASQPGDLGYPLRVVIERVPALVQIAPAGRATAEITVAERRLSELRHHVETAGQTSITALNAVLAGDRAAADQVSGLSEPERAEIAARVAHHADALTQLAQTTAEPRAANALHTAAAEALAIAARLRTGPSIPAAPPIPTASPISQPTFTPVETRDPALAPDHPASVRPTRTPEGRITGASPAASASPRPASATPTQAQTRPTLTGVPPWRAQAGSRTPEPGQRATAIVQTLTALPTRPLRPTATPTPDRTPAGPGLPPPPGPGQRATAIVETATALPAWIETRRAEHASPTPTGRPTATPSPRRGARATEIALTVTALPSFVPPPPTGTRTPWAGPPRSHTPTTRPTRTPAPSATEPDNQPTRSVAVPAQTPTTRPSSTPAPRATKPASSPTQAAAVPSFTPTARPTRTPAPPTATARPTRTPVPPPHTATPRVTEPGTRPTKTAVTAADTPAPRSTETPAPRPTSPGPGPGATAQAPTHTPQASRTPGPRG